MIFFTELLLVFLSQCTAVLEERFYINRSSLDSPLDSVRIGLSKGTLRTFLPGYETETALSAIGHRHSTTLILRSMQVDIGRDLGATLELGEPLIMVGWLGSGRLDDVSSKDFGEGSFDKGLFLKFI